MLKSRHPFLFTSQTGLVVGFLVSAQLWAAPTAEVMNPISRVARIIDSQLVETEDRVGWLEQRLSIYADPREHSMKYAVGYRGFRIQPGGADPSITLDLGRSFPIDRIFLLPLQREFLQDTEIFPRRFTLEISDFQDFSQRTILYTSGKTQFAPPNGRPAPFAANSIGRYVRLTVQEGHSRNVQDLFGLSEMAIISDSETISFGAKVLVTSSLNSDSTWSPEALVDGRTPLGLWQNALPARGDSSATVEVPSPDDTVEWKLDLQQTAGLDYMVLFPFNLINSSDSAIFPESLEVTIPANSEQDQPFTYTWNNPLPGASNVNAMVIPLNGMNAREVRVKGTKPYSFANRNLHALSEIQVWSGGKNLAGGLPVSQATKTETTLIQSLTDGQTSDKQIIRFSTWLEQISERNRLEQELASLKPLHNTLISESELNVAWGSAVVLGLTFLIPVFVVERRRLNSREQLDKLRKRIASDLHDDIGSNLGSISIIARSARKDLVRLHGPEEVADDLGELETIARESSLAMRDIVWLLERSQDSIGDLVQRMRETAGRLLREINFSLECESNKTAAKLSLDTKRHLFLFYKEAIHNVLKHSKAHKVSIRLWDEDDKFAMEILDDGIGLPLDEKNLPLKVRKLEERARVLEGSLQIASSKETGTRILLLVKRSHLNAYPTLS